MSGLQARHDLGSSLAVRDGETELLRYVYRPDTPVLESPKPYLSPLRTRSGRPASLFRPWDHVWHKGIAWSLPVVQDENFWGGPTYVHGRNYVQLDNNGTQLHKRITELEADGERVVFAHELEWLTQGGERWFTERRTVAASLLTSQAWALTFDTAMTNVSGRDLAFGSPTTRGRENAGYGGLFWRGPRSFTDGTLITADSSGPGSELRGQRHEWMAFAGRHDEDDAVSLVLMVDHRDNPRHPPQWFARSEEFAALNPAPFFSEELTVPAGDTLRFRYGVGVADAEAEAAPGLAAAVRGVLDAEACAD
jgi:hypothetical protein